ncbi:MAG: hypothetical protein NAG76_10160 [Candidatus Pristimantibacillus lignocellulolyticus]|uniref:Uncharacterized protein n=1 Tax=Candidatus Pristimantibacillus lignocellulolyticus TaxID=2994561 RepID=A0A9J6ZLJ0_9BACL|nr:MAG: hypothetical protein NAG76_10160 [Candidatus Pristimantibacillus lignocellulolyticus]
MASALFAIAAFILFSSVFTLSKGNTSMSISLLIITCIIAFFGFLLYRDEKQGKQFKEWLLSNSDHIRTHGDTFNGVRIDNQTQFMQYEICFSWVLISYRIKTSYYVKEYHPTAMLNILFCLFTCLFGLWAMPLGPIYTFQAVNRNVMVRPKLLDTVIRELRQSTRY